MAAAAYKRGTKNLNAQAMKMKAKGVTHCFFAGYAPVYANLLKEANKIGWKPLFFGDYVTVDPRAFMAGKLAHGHYHFFNLGMRHERVPGWIKMEKLFIEKLGEEALDAHKGQVLGRYRKEKADTLRNRPRQNRGKKSGQTP